MVSAASEGQGEREKIGTFFAFDRRLDILHHLLRVNTFVTLNVNISVHAVTHGIAIPTYRKLHRACRLVLGYQGLTPLP
jgi:hypothetical protein